MKIEVETKRLLAFFRAVSISGLAPKTKLLFKPDSVETLNPGVAQQIIVKAWFSRNFFINYEVPETTEVPLNCEMVLDVLKNFTSTKVRLEVDEHNLYIRGITEQGRVSEDVRIPKMTVDETILPNIQAIEVPYGELIIFGRTPEEVEEKKKIFMDNYCYARIPVMAGVKLDPLKVDKVTFAVRGGQLYLVQKNDVGVRFGKNISGLVNNAKSDFEVTIATNYAKNAMKSFLSGEIYIALAGVDGRPYPVFLCDKTSDWRITIPIAPYSQSQE